MPVPKANRPEHFCTNNTLSSFLFYSFASSNLPTIILFFFFLSLIFCSPLRTYFSHLIRQRVKKKFIGTFDVTSAGRRDQRLKILFGAPFPFWKPTLKKKSLFPPLSLTFALFLAIGRYRTTVFILRNAS